MCNSLIHTSPAGAGISRLQDSVDQNKSVIVPVPLFREYCPLDHRPVSDPEPLASRETGYHTSATREKRPPEQRSARQKLSKKMVLLLTALVIGLSICSVNLLMRKKSPPLAALPYKQMQKPLPQKGRIDTSMAKKEIKDSGEKERDIRKNWHRYIHATHSNYGYGIFGGINNLSIHFDNQTDYILEEISAKVTYIKANGKPWKTKYISLFHIPPHSEKKQPLPKVNRGKSVEVTIVRIVSKSMHFKYEPGRNSGITGDPYYLD